MSQVEHAVERFDEEPLPPLRWRRSSLAVAIGGALGVWGRVEVLHWTATTPAHGARDWVGLVPWGLLVINTVGVLVATWLLRGPLAHRSPDDFWRLLSVTGLFGGLTSYSTLAVDLAAVKAVSLGGALVTGAGAFAAAGLAAVLGATVARR